MKEPGGGLGKGKVGPSNISTKGLVGDGKFVVADSDFLKSDHSILVAFSCFVSFFGLSLVAGLF